MGVYDSTGQHLGTVADVYPNIQRQVAGNPQDEQQSRVRVEDTAENYGPTGAPSRKYVDPHGNEMTGDISSVESPRYYDRQPGSEWQATVSSGMYFRLSEGGIVGIGATDLYIPYSAISKVFPDDRVILSVTKDEVNQSYAQKPSSLP